MENLNVVELNKPEMLEISGGSRFGRLVQAARVLLEAAGAYDAYHSFMDGWENCAPEE